MSSIASNEMKHIPRARWEEWCDLFSNGNRGRLICLETDDVPGNELLVEGARLVAFDYDPPGKGNAFIISYGTAPAPTRHVVNDPTTLWQDQDSNGLVVSVNIEDEQGNVTLCRLN